jgi:type IX secretion system PorP/SprF family membrane protein
MRKKILLFITIFILTGFSAIAQDPLFSSTIDNPLYYNPAIPGIFRGNEYRLNYREQWPGIPAAMRAFNFSSTHQLKNKVGIGFLVMSNIEGESRIRTDKVEATIAFPVQISRFLKISGGINAGYGQKSIDWTRVEFDDQYDKYYGKIYPTGFPFPNNYQRKYGDLSIGLAAKGILNRGKNQPQVFGTLGVSMKHISIFPSANFIGSDIRSIPVKYIVHGNVWFLDKTRTRGMVPNFNVESQASMTTINVSTRVVLKPIYFSLGVRNRNYKFSPERFDSFIFGFGYMSDIVHGNLSNIGYTYDFTTSRLLGGTYGSHEIHMSYSFDIEGIRNSRRARGNKNDFGCPMDFGNY